MAYKPGIFQYGTSNAYVDGYDKGQITTLPSFNVNETPGFNNLNDLDLYNAGLSSGNIFYSGYVPGGSGSAGGDYQFDPNYNADNLEKARLFFEKQKADEQARLAEEARLAK
jgi:hypothetical protein